MKTAQAGVDLIKEFESFKSRVYLCPAKKRTIGYGHVILPGETHLQDATITIEQGTRLLHNDLIEREAAVLKWVDVALTQCQFDALVSFVFNVGANNFRGSRLLRKLNAGDYDGAADEFLNWNKSTIDGEKVVLNGLVKRRKAERKLFKGE